MKAKIKLKKRCIHIKYQPIEEDDERTQGGN